MMMVVGLTGGSGVGKTTLCQALEQMQIPSLNTDLLSRAVTTPGTPCLSELIEFFGTGILRADGTLNRRRLAQMVFGEEDEHRRAEKQARLNAVTHKYILAACGTWLAAQRAAGAELVVIDAPLLFESGFDRQCDVTVGAVSHKELRIARITERDDISQSAAETRIAAQLDDAALRARCDYILENNGTQQAFEHAAQTLFSELRARAVAAGGAQ